MKKTLSTPNVPSVKDNSFLEQVLTYAETVEYLAGDVVVSPESGAEQFYFVYKGTAEVSYTDSGQTTITVALIGNGEFFGEIGYFDNGSRVRTIVAVDKLELAVFDRGTMEQLRSDNPDLYIDFVHYLTRRICKKFRNISGDSAPVAAYADALANRRSSKYGEAKSLPKGLVNSESWHFIHGQGEKVSMELFSISHKLQDLTSRNEKDDELENYCLKVFASIIDIMPVFEEKIAGSGHEDVLWGYIFKEIYPYIMRSQFAQRTYHKPKGYAGDFLMMEHMYKNIPEGQDRLGELVDEFCLGRPAAKAIRGRRSLLADQLAKLTGQLTEQDDYIKVMNLACGPNREFFDFLKNCEYDDKIEALCVDIDAEALQYTNKFVNTFSHRASIRLMRENVIKWSLGKVNHNIGPQDVIYSAGLCDYLGDRMFKALIVKCYHNLKPGGALVLGNFAPHQDVVFLDRILRWQLIYRTEEQLKKLFEDTPFSTVTILSEDEHVNLFALAVRK